MKFPARAALTLASLLWSSSPFAVTAAEPTAPALAPTHRIELFDGRSLAGWTGFMQNGADPLLTWKAENGLLKCTGRPNGYLRTDRSYRSYKLTLEWRFVTVAPRADNGGILVHMAETDKLWPRCFQCQGQHGKIGDLILMDGAECKEHQGLTVDRLSTRDAAAEKPVGEWNTCEIICAGDTLRILLNGKLVNEATGCNVTSGRIGLQSEGGAFEVRRAFLEPAGKP